METQDLYNTSSNCWLDVSHHENSIEDDTVCNAIGCDSESSEKLCLKAGNDTIMLSVCKACKKFFVEDSNDSDRVIIVHNDITSDSDTLL
jgi:hypothetical protein